MRQIAGMLEGSQNSLFFRELMARINTRRRQSGKLEPWQLFNLIAGTSTGGYVALSQA